jgi:hypothetical protein
MRRAAAVIGVVCALLALVLLAVGVRQEIVLVPLFVIGLAGLAFTVGGRAGVASAD